MKILIINELNSSQVLSFLKCSSSKYQTYKCGNNGIVKLHLPTIQYQQYKLLTHLVLSIPNSFPPYYSEANAKYNTFPWVNISVRIPKTERFF